MANIDVDPITKVYNELWLILEDSPDFTHRVKGGNKINYVGKQDPEKQEIATADFPEVAIIAAVITPHLQNTSNSSRLTARFSIEIRTGTKDVSEVHYPIIWAIYKAMRPWAKRLTALTISENDSSSFVVLARPQGDITEGIERGETSRSIEGWFEIWVIEIDMWFRTSALS